MWWLYYSCFLCLTISNNRDLTMVHAAYSEADDLINELDRPSKYNFELSSNYPFHVN